MLDILSEEEIAKSLLAKKVARERERGRENYVANKQREERKRKFHERNGFTLQEWHERVKALRCVCQFCGCKLTQDPGKDNSAVRWSQDGSKSLEKAIPVCRACLCRRIGPLGPKKADPR
jgi:hypothetical protein